jgi:hypothetical protein
MARARKYSDQLRERAVRTRLSYQLTERVRTQWQLGSGSGFASLRFVLGGCDEARIVGAQVPLASALAWEGARPLAGRPTCNGWRRDCERLQAGVHSRPGGRDLTVSATAWCEMAGALGALMVR